MIVADINKFTIEELEVAKLKYGVTLNINDGKIVGIVFEGRKRGEENA